MLAPLAKVTEGIAVIGGVDPEHSAIDATMLLRPTSLDRIEIEPVRDALGAALEARIPQS